jgi:uncharacterized protein (DUF885 family)
MSKPLIVRPARHRRAGPGTAWPVCLGLAVLLLSSAAFAADDSAAFRQLYQQEWAFRTHEFPPLAAANGLDSGGHLTRVSMEDQQRRYRYWQDIRERLDAISCERLEREECINYRIFKRQMDEFINSYETRAYLLPFNSDWGFYMSWARMANPANFSKPQDYRNYLVSLRELPEVMDEYIALMRLGLELGFTQPRAVLDGRDAPIRAQIVANVEESPYYAPFKVNLDLFADDDLTEMDKEARQLIAEGVIPAHKALLKFLQEEYIPGARSTLGASELPDGQAFYAGQVREYVTLDMSPGEIHAIGLAEVARIRKEMDEIIERLEFNGDFAAFIDFLRNDPQFYANTPRELLAEASYIAKKVDGRLPQLFGRLPRQPYGVAPVPEEIAPFFTAGRYVGAPADARQGGYYWVNTHLLDSRTLYTLPALTLHEAAPGHHLQAALALEQGEQPPFRRSRYISAYGEGWALYAEKLGVELGIYETPYEDFGRLTYEMWRASRLVIDTGVHAMGWTREQALDFLSGNTALSLHEVSTEVDRYISWPAQALSYKLGEYTIWQLRRDAEQRLGSAFDLRAFHDFILALGSVPLDVLQDEVERWTSEQTPGL